MFYGTTRLTMDDKHRIVIPARPRKKLMDMCEGEVVMTARTREHILLYPLPEFEALLARLDQLPDLDQASNDFKLSFTANARDESIDRALSAWPLIARADWNGATQRLNTRPAAPKAPR